MSRKLKRLDEGFIKRTQQSLKETSKKSKVVRHIEISIVIPMFGGGVKAGEVDQKNPVRTSTIRGHLRFWWRATRGAEFDNAFELREEEVKIFGDTTTPSAVKMWATCSGKGDRVERDKSVPNYVSSLLSKGTTGFRKITFTLHIQVNNSQKQLLDKELAPALWAWINFGGIGARTRRGCGSLYCKSFSPPEGKDINKWFAEQIRKYGLELPTEENLLSEEECREWPVLYNFIITKHNHRAEFISSAWKAIINSYKYFRRRANDGTRTTKGGYKIPGRSRWPEADAVRKITGMAESNHKNSVILENESDIGFPRAQLGLPIRFKFTNFGKDREPYATTLLPKDGDRLASPLIIKALAVSPYKGYGIVALLSQPKLEALELKWSEDEEKLRHPEENDYKQKKKQDFPVIPSKQIYATPEYKHQYKNVNPLNSTKGLTKSAVEAFINSKEILEWQKK